MTHDVANTERFSAVMNLCDEIDQFIWQREDTEDRASQRLLTAIGQLVGTVLFSIRQRRHHTMTIDARFGLTHFDDAALWTTVDPADPDPDPPRDQDRISYFLEKHRRLIHNDLINEADPSTEGVFDALLEAIGAIQSTHVSGQPTDMLIHCYEQDGKLVIKANQVRLE